MKVAAHVAALVLLASAGAGPVQAQSPPAVAPPSRLTRLVPAEAVEGQAAKQFDQLKQAAARKGALVAPGDPRLRRLRTISQRIIPQALQLNARARQWQWEVVLIDSKEINAFCMPGGKIAFYTGILERLRLDENEIAAVMGHEIAHALQEHARERIAKSQLTQLGASLLGELLGGGRYSDLFSVGGNLLTLRFSRDDESEADIVGLELSARAGFDPRAGVSLWRKMSAASAGGPPQWLSTHPSGKNRIAEMQKHLPRVMPIYRQASGRG